MASEPSKHLKDGLRRCLINRGKLPPVETRWKPGQSGNPKGRPKKEKLLEPLIRELLESKRRGDKEGRQWKMIVAEELLRQFTKGNPAAIKEVLNRIDGPVKQSVEIDAEVEAKTNAREYLIGEFNRIRARRKKSVSPARYIHR